MTRTPRTRSTLARLRARQKAPDEAVFNASPGTRYLAAGMCFVLAVLFLIHQTQIEGAKPLVRGFAAFASLFLGGLGWYFWHRARRRGPVLRIDKQGFGFALGHDTWLDFTWDQVKAFRYWEPTGIAMLVKRRQSRWVGVLLNHNLPASSLPWDARFEIWLNTFHNRPGLCLLHPFVDAPILDVLQAFKDYAPKELDEYDWMSK